MQVVIDGRTGKSVSWDKDKYFLVACRICGGEMLFPKSFYRQEDLTGWECKGSVPGICQERKQIERIIGD